MSRICTWAKIKQRWVGFFVWCEALAWLMGLACAWHPTPLHAFNFLVHRIRWFGHRRWWKLLLGTLRSCSCSLLLSRNPLHKHASSYCYLDGHVTVCSFLWMNATSTWLPYNRSAINWWSVWVMWRIYFCKPWMCTHEERVLQVVVTPPKQRDCSKETPNLCLLLGCIDMLKHTHIGNICVISSQAEKNIYFCCLDLLISALHQLHFVKCLVIVIYAHIYDQHWWNGTLPVWGASSEVRQSTWCPLMYCTVAPAFVWLGPTSWGWSPVGISLYLKSWGKTETGSF